MGDFLPEKLLFPDQKLLLMTFTNDWDNTQSNGSCTREDFNTSFTVESFPLLKSARSESFYSDGNIQNPAVLSSYTKVEDMLFWCYAAVMLIIVRWVVERHIFIPLGKRLGIKENRKKENLSCRNMTALPLLENTYSANPKKFPDPLIDKLCTETGLHAREIERWVRKRRAADRPSNLTKFSESGWRFVSYVLSTSIGIWAIWNKPWVWDTKLCLINHPKHDLPSEIWMYYLYGSGLYISYLITQAFDVKRKDFWEMFVHHIVTILLIGISWNYNLTRIGVYVLLLHDCGDIFLEGAKMANYMKKQDLSTGIFVVFTVVWTVTRLIIYPKTVVITIIQYVITFDELPPRVAIVITGMLVLLFGLHVFWTYFICKLAISVLKSGTEGKKDARSSTESEISEESETETLQKDSSIISDREKTTKERNRETGLIKKFSLQYENAAQMVENINRKQRAVMKRISVEIM